MTNVEDSPVIASASEAIHLSAKQVWIASSLSLLAMTNSFRPRVRVLMRFATHSALILRSALKRASRRMGRGPQGSRRPLHGLLTMRVSLALLADLPPWQIKSAPWSCGRLTRRANHFGLSEMKVKPRNQKYFCFRLTQISSLIRTVSSHQRGDRASSRARGGMRWTRQHQASECKPDE
jgi:hypothetical protein